LKDKRRGEKFGKSVVKFRVVLGFLRVQKGTLYEKDFIRWTFRPIKTR